MSPPVQLQKTERPGWILLTPLSKSLVSPWTSTPTQSPLKRNQKKTHYSSSKDRLFDTEPLPKKAKRPQPQAPTPLPPPQVRGQCSTKQRADVITNITLLLQTVPASEATEVNHNSVHITQAVAQSDAPWLEAGQDRWPNRANYDALSMPRENSQHSSWPSEDQSSQSEAGHNNIMQTPQVPNHSQTTKAKVATETVIYKQEAVIDGEADPLEWWRINNSCFPLWSNVACKYLCICTTSISSERTFSTAGHVATPQRSLLKPAKVDMLVYLAKNL
ncbi:uncharacterized protein LOC122974803 isoform X7 [Thunnus albacares]|uniref:uncharacterized protein LOC122974803 isoform X7 n=1 Tax=Thunnus albacares TaxID=8236 RepID=UPI001CF64D6E|nr:uncharacterized protein LOC122974803 isoform X7 [Thunnus albacares]